MRQRIRPRASIRVENRIEKKTDCQVTCVRIDDAVEVGTRDGWVCFWVAGREVRIGPLSATRRRSWPRIWSTRRCA